MSNNKVVDTDLKIWSMSEVEKFISTFTIDQKLQELFFKLHRNEISERQLTREIYQKVRDAILHIYHLENKQAKK